MSRRTSPTTSRTGQRPNGAAGRQLFRPEDGRRHNMALVLQKLYDTPGLSRADLARATGLTRVTISTLVAELLDDGLVAETGLSDASRPGKPGTKLNLIDQARQIIAIDLSAEPIMRGGLVDLRGQITKRLDYPLEGATGQAAIAQVCRLIQALADSSSQPILGAGVGTPGLVTGEGIVQSASNLDWHELDLQSELAATLGIPVVVQNDANAAAVAEQRFGGGNPNLIRLQLAWGLGAGLLVDSEPVIGDSSAAGEIGHIIIDPAGEPCRCGKAGCLETWASLYALKPKLAAQPGRRDEILAQAGYALATALTPAVAFLDITEIILGGPSDIVGGSLLQACQEQLAERSRADYRTPVEIRLSTLGDDAVLLGATALVLRRCLGIA